MKKLLNLYWRFQVWRYHRKFCKLLMLFIDKHGDVNSAICQAVTAFEWMYGFEYSNLYHHFRTQVGLKD